jgi:hypothetical protein
MQPQASASTTNAQAGIIIAIIAFLILCCLCSSSLAAVYYYYYLPRASMANQGVSGPAPSPNPAMNRQLTQAELAANQAIEIANRTTAAALAASSKR